MKEDYVSFEVAKLLKEKGFDERCIMFYHNNELTSTVNLESVKENASCVFNSWLYEGDYTAPTLQMTMKWLRKVHNLHITISVYTASNGIMYAYEIIKLGLTASLLREKSGFENNEEAVESALNYCLTNLI